MLYVFECGQGDSLKISSEDCYWSPSIPLYVDLGPTGHTKTIPEQEIDLLITHSHNDHVSGMQLASNAKIRTLYVPAYYPEISKIVAKLTKKIPRFGIGSCAEIKVLYEGITIHECGHIAILNPPLDPSHIFNVDQVDEQNIDAYLDGYGTSVGDIINNRDTFGTIAYPLGYDPIRFVRIAVHLISKLDKGNIQKAIDRFLEYDANKMSIVFLYQDRHMERHLLTGDADKSVFYRLIKTKPHDIRADVLKVPHHGSKYSLNKRILKRISPKVAIVSHDNGIFGRAIDPHPNKEVVKCLSDLGVKTFFTNDVVKTGKATIKRHKGGIPGANVAII